MSRTDLSITKIPAPSDPKVFSTGTLTLSKVTKAVPAAEDYVSLSRETITLTRIAHSWF